MAMPRTEKLPSTPQPSTKQGNSQPNSMTKSDHEKILDEISQEMIESIKSRPPVH
jgi:hypothetical protein